MPDVAVSIATLVAVAVVALIVYTSFKNRKSCGSCRKTKIFAASNKQQQPQMNHQSDGLMGHNTLPSSRFPFQYWGDKHTDNGDRGTVVVSSVPLSKRNQTSVLGQIEHKTENNFFGTDYQHRIPMQKFAAADGSFSARSNEWPLAGACMPAREPPQLGLNGAEVVQGENTMRLYSTYTSCPGELNHRYMSAQM